MSNFEETRADDPTIEGDPDFVVVPPSQLLERGQTVGRYVVLSRVGEGAMGVVYAAYDPELDRKVALKLLARRLQHSTKVSTGRQRLMREAKAMAKVSQPNVITVHDVGTFGERVFVAMEFVDGSTLARWQRHKPWRAVLGKYPDIRVKISGHTDSHGDKDHNMDLSRRRAESVKTWLTEHGIDAARMETQGFGPDKAIHTNDTKAGRGKNRRIEFEILSN